MGGELELEVEERGRAAYRGHARAAPAASAAHPVAQVRATEEAYMVG
jgi:hypothetical protein